MGYRSQIIFVVEKPLVSSLLTLFATNPTVREMLTCDNPIKQSDKGDMLFQIDWIKWYDAYKGIGAIEKFMCDLETEDLEYEFGFHRLGEELGDHEHRGLSELYEVYPMQSLACH